MNPPGRIADACTQSAALRPLKTGSGLREGLFLRPAPLSFHQFLLRHQPADLFEDLLVDAEQRLAGE